MSTPFLQNNRLLWAFLLVLGLGVGAQAPVADEPAGDGRRSEHDRDLDLLAGLAVGRPAPSAGGGMPTGAPQLMRDAGAKEKRRRCAVM